MSIGFLKVFSICANYTIPGFKFVESLCNFSLDKLLGVWYNGNNAPQERGRRVEKPPPTFAEGGSFLISASEHNNALLNLQLFGFVVTAPTTVAVITHPLFVSYLDSATCLDLFALNRTSDHKVAHLSCNSLIGESGETVLADFLNANRLANRH